MLDSALSFLLHTIFTLLTFMFLLRFFMQMLRAPFMNLLGQTVIALTDFIVKPSRRLIPSLGKLDMATLLLAFICQLVLYFLLTVLRGHPFGTAVLGLAFLGVARAALDIFFYAILLQAILSWVNPYTPITGVLDALTRPILAPIRSAIPVMNGLDLSPLVGLVLLQMLNISVISVLTRQLEATF